MTAGRTEVGSIVVVGLGNRDRGDDGVGPDVVARAASLLPGVRVVEHEDPTSLMDLWEGARSVIVVDAVRSGRPPGTLVVLEAGADSAPIPGDPWTATGRGGTHALGLAATLELARALGRLPPRVVVLGVEAAGVGHGTATSPEVAAAVPAAVAALVAVADRERGVG